MKPGNGIKTIAMKVSVEELEAKTALAREVLGGKEVYVEPGLAVFQLPDGQLMELYGPGSSYPDYLFNNSEVVISFRVSNMEQALERVTRAGMEIISGIQRIGSCSAYCYIRDKKGTIFGLTS